MNKKGISFGKISFQQKTDAESSKKDEDASASGFGTFGRIPIQEPKEIEELADDLESQQIQQTIGFKNFGKKAKSIDINEMVNQAKKLAEEVSKKRLLLAAQAPNDTKENEELIGPLPPKDEEEGLIGPPIPQLNSAGHKGREKDGDDDDGSDSYDELSGSDDEETGLEKRIPQSHEVRK